MWKSINNPKRPSNTTTPIPLDTFELQNLQTAFQNRVPLTGPTSIIALEKLEAEWKRVAVGMEEHYRQHVMSCRICRGIHRVSEPLENRFKSLVDDMGSKDARVVNQSHLLGFLRRFAALEKDWVREVEEACKKESLEEEEGSLEEKEDSLGEEEKNLGDEEVTEPE